ncbi:Hypothetical protein D9617_44g038980 [Elsinoe fawcettii]|nr:Hypothetical protein D9617_44g038980 [Elsinoe fawcettii]
MLLPNILDMTYIGGLDQSKRLVLMGTGRIKQVVRVLEKPSKPGKLNPVLKKRKSATHTPPSTSAQETPKRRRTQKPGLWQAASESSLDTTDETSPRSDHIDASSISAIPSEIDVTSDKEYDISELEKEAKALTEKTGNAIGRLQREREEQKECLRSKQQEYERATIKMEGAKAEYARQHAHFTEVQAQVSAAQIRLTNAQTELDEAKSRLDGAELVRGSAAVERDRAVHEKQDKEEEMKQAESLYSTTEGMIVRLENLLGAKGAAAANRPGQGPV